MLTTFTAMWYKSLLRAGTKTSNIGSHCSKPKVNGEAHELLIIPYNWCFRSLVLISLFILASQILSVILKYNKIIQCKWSHFDSLKINFLISVSPCFVIRIRSGGEQKWRNGGDEILQLSSQDVQCALFILSGWGSKGRVQEFFFRIRHRTR